MKVNRNKNECNNLDIDKCNYDNCIITEYPSIVYKLIEEKVINEYDKLFTKNLADEIKDKGGREFIKNVIVKYCICRKNICDYADCNDCEELKNEYLELENIVQYNPIITYTIKILEKYSIYLYEKCYNNITDDFTTYLGDFKIPFNWQDIDFEN